MVQRRRKITRSIPNGHFSIGVYRPKTIENLGTLWRSAFQLGATEIFTIGERWPKKQASDTVVAWKKIPLRKYPSIPALKENLPYSCPLVGVEMGGTDLVKYSHPLNACYLLGAEDSGLPPWAQNMCHSLISIPSVRTSSFNVAVAGSLVMWDRMYEKKIED